jgi:hypothetical protein
MVIERGAPLLAQDVLDLTFFPVGTILMYDGVNWADGRGGWYICDGRSTPYGSTPDLRDKFIRGSGIDPQTGDGEMTLEIRHLPEHKHGITDKTHSHSVSAKDIGRGHSSSYSNAVASGGNYTTGSAYTGITETDYAGSGEAFAIVPAYYAVIYIKKMTGNNA